MDQHREDGRIGWPTLAGLAIIVVAFMVLSLLVTATGTARFAVAMGYDASVGYVVGAIFDLAKGILPVALLALLARRALGTAAPLGAAWICLVVFSCLATHATVSTAISAIERTGTRMMETRGNAKAEMARVEQQLAALSRPTPPRPAKTVREALAGTSVPSGIWKDSHECANIQESTYFAKACAQVVQLRRELAAAQDYERLSSRAAELRKGLAVAPIVATADPLPAAFSATLGRVLPLSGTEGVALLLTVVVELVGCFGLAWVAALYGIRDKRDGSGRPAQGSQGALQVEGVKAEGALRGAQQSSLPRQRQRTLPRPSLEAVTRVVAHATREASNPPSNVLPMRPRPPCANLPNPSPTKEQGGSLGEPSTSGSHVPTFVADHLQVVAGSSVSAKDLREAYEIWCAARDLAPLSLPKFTAAMKTLGIHDKWKSCGLVRYRDLYLVA